MKNLFKIVFFAFVFGILSGCGSGENSNSDDFVFPKQEYVKCFNNESEIVRFIGNDGKEINTYSIPFSGCKNVFDYKKGEYLEGEYLFTIVPDVLNDSLLSIYEHQLYKAYKHNGKLVFYYEMPNYQSPPIADTINVFGVSYKKYSYRRIELPKFTTKESFFNFVAQKQIEVDYIMHYSFAEQSNIVLQYSIGYFKNNEFIMGRVSNF
ncbi:MAG: hypothetical protein LBH98_05130 [Chitinispirillales bacterium]|jgi:hypothetical protein|nr:hypothetical protein [Chitinispirillales bacterium]